MSSEEPEPKPKKDFFISYQRKDVAWAEWIAWELEEKGYTIVFQKWQWGVGSDFAHNMHNALRTCERTIAVLSPNYFNSQYTEKEWTSVWGRDVDGERGLLIPVEIEPSEEDAYGLLQNIVRITLHDKSEEEAREELLAGLKPPEKPASRPTFPLPRTSPARASKKTRFPSQLPPVFALPTRRNPLFTGRDAELDALHDQLKVQKVGAITQTITGLGGVGKTAMAVEYCYRFSHEYDTVLWLRAEEEMTSQYAGLADDLGIQIPPQETEARIKAVKNWFGQNQKWLLVFDNATSAKSMKEFQPLGGGGHILITSRTRGEWRNQELSLKVWDLPTSVEYIQKCLPNATNEDAEKLAKVLGYLPLALAQATAYTHYEVISITDYLQRLNNTHYNVFDEGELDEYELRIARTWNLSFDAVRAKIKDNPVPEERVLALLSTLAPDAIPRSIFRVGTEEIKIGMGKWLAELNHYSLIELEEEELSVHRLVQEVIRRSPNCPDRRTSLKVTIYAVTQADPGYDFVHWEAHRKLEPHWRECWKGIREAKVVSEQAGLLLNQYGYYLEDQGRYEEAEPLYNGALAIYRQSLPAGHPDIARSLNNLAVLYKTQGRYREAESLFNEALAIARHSLPEGHPDIATSLNNLAELYRTQGRCEEAEPLFNKALTIRRQSLPERHPDIANSLDNMAGLYQTQGRYEEAEHLYNEALDIRRQSLPERHPDIAGNLNNLAELYRDQGRYAEAEPLFNEALAIARHSLHEGHPHIAICLNNLSGLYQTQGRYEKAEHLSKEAVEITEKALGCQHPNTRTLVFNLFRCYVRQEKVAEAQEVMNRYPEIVIPFIESLPRG